MRSQNSADNWIVMFWTNIGFNELNIIIQGLLMPNKGRQLSLEILFIVHNSPRHYLAWVSSITLIRDSPRWSQFRTISWFLTSLLLNMPSLPPVAMSKFRFCKIPVTSQIQTRERARARCSFNHISNALLGSVSWHFLPHLWFIENFNIFHHKLGQWPSINECGENMNYRNCIKYPA